MTPELISLLIFGVQELIKQAPSIAEDIRTLFSKGIPSDQDWADLRAKVLGETYASYVPDSILPPDPISNAPAPTAAPLVTSASPEATPSPAMSALAGLVPTSNLQAATPAPTIAAASVAAPAKPALTYEALIAQSKTQVDGEPYAATVMARLIALEQVVEKMAGKSLDEVLAWPG